jgi:hypothetical protein
MYADHNILPAMGTCTYGNNTICISSPSSPVCIDPVAVLHLMLSPKQNNKVTPPPALPFTSRDPSMFLYNSITGLVCLQVWIHTTTWSFTSLGPQHLLYSGKVNAYDFRIDVYSYRVISHKKDESDICYILS